MKRVVLLMMLLLSLTLVGVINAQDQTEDPNENACYTGGALEGKCSAFSTEEENEWAWNCGYYYASYVNAEISFEQVPETCQILVETVEPVSYCEQFSDEAFIHVYGFPNQPGNAGIYVVTTRGGSTNCPGQLIDAPAIWMQAPDFITVTAALEACAAADPSVSWNTAYQIDGLGLLTGFNWFCTVMK